MLYCVCPLGRETGGLTCVLRPDPVMGEAAWTKEVREANNRTREKPNVRKGISPRVLLVLSQRRTSSWSSAFTPQTLNCRMTFLE